MWALLFLAAVLHAAPVTAPQVQRLRAAAGLPAFDPARLAALNPPTLAAAHLQASHDLLARVTPAAPAPLVAEARAAVAEDRAYDKLDAVAAHVARGGDALDKTALEALYDGSPFGVRGDWAKELVRDGARTQALRLASTLKLPPSRLAALRRMPEAPVPAAFERRLEEARALVKDGDWTSAWSAARGLIDDILASGLRTSTRRALAVDASLLLQKAKDYGAPRLYGSRPSDLEETVTRQRHSDCAVHQLYNHPALAPLAALIPYRQFLRGVEKLLGARVRSTGMSDADTSRVLRQLGLSAKRLEHPKDAAALERLLEEHGPLLVSIRWDKPKDFRSRSGNHAILVREAKDGAFTVIDSNFGRPQSLTYEELGVLGAGGYAAVQGKLNARSFLTVVPPPAPWWRRLLNLD